MKFVGSLVAATIIGSATSAQLNAQIAAAQDIEHHVNHYSNLLGGIKDDDRYSPIIKLGLNFCIDNMDEHWEWCRDNVLDAYYANQFMATKDEIRIGRKIAFEQGLQS